jgi:hypothetical protein
MQDKHKEAAQLAVEWISRWLELDAERGINDPYFAWAGDRLEEMHNNPKLVALYITGFVNLCGHLMVDIAAHELDDYENLPPEQKLAAGRKILQETILSMMNQ